ncbi:MAG: aldo/keto reductase [Planctomycetota bacterium]|nr:aldo/keto reductase [Planctomycetota bacterium]
MHNDKLSRRSFVHNTSLAALGTVAAALAAHGCASGNNTRSADASKVDTSKISNYNPKMHYRRLGKTNLMISEVSLGGHGSLGLENRVEVLQRAAELGMNYLDTNIVEECKLYGEALRGKRKSWHWGEGQTSIPTLLMVSRRVLDMVVEVFEKVRNQGKVRWLGISAHNPKVFHRVLNDCPQFSVIHFPYLFLTNELGGDSLLSLAQKKDVGVIGIKPFGAGTTFGIKPSELHGAVDKNAHVLVRKMLQETRISAIIPGVNTTSHLEENVNGSYERDKPLTRRDMEVIRQCTENYYANLSPEYQWLKNWEVV